MGSPQRMAPAAATPWLLLAVARALTFSTSSSEYMLDLPPPGLRMRRIQPRLTYA
ncbi:hypothetical protein [Ramlibacter sp.]|uniref:hypothetical protein n=1 Tax=Ramlibacter sp. TaxID=1917967 RepID=UPI002D7F056E|nr:hypothetical protein [Ramlibacter sp.]